MDILSVIEGFLQIVPETLNDGYTVDLGDLGSMGVIAKSEPTETEEEFNESHIEGAKVVFRPGKLLKTAMKTADFVRISENGH
ncbi:hypothetical protein NC99_21620 [Sunxiuqinia dokdonensis]|uniref:HU domain-containing protein n=2 Tax=Sunxiuqinia dokdonensis TaxID=1409788 RepID=A0A0L8VA01_9BACT|nr:hypothetical protein NC99_21620 [Sunxiuqinia dokdonensis]